MSRITGIIRQDSIERTGESLAAMLGGASSSPNWQRAAARSGHCAMGWTGWKASNLSVKDSLVAVVDGCFFNRRELPQGESDAAILCALYRGYGFPEALGKINGDFAVALYDSVSDTLWLGRDRVGAKPLYYVHKADFFAFGSRARALFPLRQVSTQVSDQFVALFAASHYRYFDNNPHASPYADIAQLPAAHALCVRDGHARLSRYWTLEEQPDWADNEQQLAEQYRELLLDAVDLRQAAAERPAFTLSGGMDSSSVLASAVHVSRQKQHAFSTVYEDKTYDESDEIQPILEQTVTRWHTVKLGTPNVFDLVEHMIDAHDEPVATATWLSHYQLCVDAATRGFGSLFGGLGGDELNAGEYEYFLFHFADLRAGGEEEQLQHEIERWIRYHDHPIFRKSRGLVEDCFRQIVDLSRIGVCQPDRRRLSRYFEALNPEFGNLREFRPVMDHPFRSYLKNRTYQDIFRETAPCCLRAEDRQAVAFGLDNYLPFFDYRLIEFMFRVPGDLKIRDGVTKRLLRTAMRGILPDETRNRIKKTGWNAPAHVWFSGDGRQPLMDLIRSRAFRERGIYDVRTVERLAADHESIVSTGKPVENHMMFFWQLVNLELWHRRLDHIRLPLPGNSGCHRVELRWDDAA